VFELPREGWRLYPLQLFSPLNTLSNYVLGVSYILYTYDLNLNFGRVLTVEKFNSPANFSEFKHCLVRLFIGGIAYCASVNLRKGLNLIADDFKEAKSSMFDASPQRINIMVGRFLAFYARKQLLLSARLSHRTSVCLSVCPSVTRVDQSKAVQAKITKSSPSAAWKTQVSGTVKLFHKFEGGHPERGR